MNIWGKKAVQNCRKSTTSLAFNRFLKTVFEKLIVGEYPAVVSGATEVQGTSINGGSDWGRGSRVLAVVISLAEFPWIILSIISVSSEIWAWSGLRFALILSSIMSGENPAPARFFVQLRLLLPQLPFLLRERTFLDVRANRSCSRFSVFYKCGKRSCNRRRGYLRFEPMYFSKIGKLFKFTKVWGFNRMQNDVLARWGLWSSDLTQYSSNCLKLSLVHLCYL